MKPVQPVVLRQAAQQMEAGPLSRSPTWVSVALTSQPSPMCPSRLVLFQGSSLHGRQAAPSSAGEVGRGSGGPGGGAGGAGGQTQSFLPQLGQTRSPGHFCSGLACGAGRPRQPHPHPHPLPHSPSQQEKSGVRARLGCSRCSPGWRTGPGRGRGRRRRRAGRRWCEPWRDDGSSSTTNTADSANPTCSIWRSELPGTWHC